MYEQVSKTEFEDLAIEVEYTENVLLRGGEFKKGSVLASRGVATAAVKAKQSVTFSGTPVASKTIKVKAAGKEVSYTTSTTTLNTEVSSLASAINNDSAMGDLVTATASSGKLSIEYDVAGSAGNDALGIEVTLGDGVGVTAGDVAVEVIGQDVGQEIFELVDSDNGTSALQTPVAVLLEDGNGGEYKAAAFAGKFNASKLVFSEGDTINNFKVALRKIGIFPVSCAD